MRISDWSSYVCSSDLLAVLPVKRDARESDRALAFPTPVERDALAFAGIPPFEAIDGRGDPGQPVRVKIGVQIFAGQPQLVAVRGVIDNARERAVRAAVLRLGFGAPRARPADVTLVVELDRKGVV